MRKINQPPSGIPSKPAEVVVATPAPIVEETVADVVVVADPVEETDAAIVEETPKKRSRKKSETLVDADGVAEEAQSTEEPA
jgi:hypothetical protein